MKTLESIQARRSIRKFTGDPVSEEDIRALLEAATLAPSGKNKQPWRFVVVQGDGKRAEMIEAMNTGIANAEAMGIPAGSSKWTVKIMAHAPVTIFIFADMKTPEQGIPDYGQMLGVLVDVQSVGAAIQNMLLEATDRGLGTLWICDVFYATRELGEWLGEDRLMVAAVPVGVPDETPNPRPRMSVDEVTTWVK